MRIKSSKHCIYAELTAKSYAEEEKLSVFLASEIKKGNMFLISSNWEISGECEKRIIISSLATAQRLREFIEGPALFDHGVDYHEL